MAPDLLHRLRWRNLARAAGAVVVVAAVVAWPRLGPTDPRLPAPGAVPLVEPAPVPRAAPQVVRRRPEPVGERPHEPVRPPRVAAKGRAPRDRVVRRPRPTVAPVAPVVPAAAPTATPPVAPPAAPPRVDPAQEEFGIEGG